MSATTLPAVINSYKVFGLSLPEMQESLTDFLEGASIAEHDLKQVKVPSGGMTLWQIPSAGRDENVETFEGIIVHQKPQRTLFKDKFGVGEAAPPLCSSDDSIVGFGYRDSRDEQAQDWQHDCASCHFGMFGPNNQKPLCGSKTRLFVLRANDMLPLCLIVPPTGLKVLRRYQLDLATEGLAYFSVSTIFGLVKVPQQGGTPAYSAITFAKGTELDREQLALARSYSSRIKTHMVRAPRTPQGSAASYSDLGLDEMQEEVL